MLGLWLRLWENILMELIDVRIFILTADGTIPSARDPELYIMEKVSKVLRYIYQNYTLQIFFHILRVLHSPRWYLACEAYCLFLT